ncbi:deoxyribose-phosphate aldolase [Curvivirga sp.]|uniref:deoxyribose-phosphate aldolase n=1 Tax=Curvivirga sp. TaxID=2856848 RepID=UPI003B59916B
MNLTEAAKKSIACLDLTSLNDGDTEDDVKALCAKAQTTHGNTAAVCVWPRFAALAVDLLKDTDIKVAAVANFPDGGSDVDQAVSTTKQIVEAGAHEVDVVFPYRAYLRGDGDIATQLVSATKAACGDHVKLKVIIESGELATEAAIRGASEISLKAGADFIKTSTGKSPISATPEAAKTMLEAIKAHGSGAFKASGGIRDTETAAQYLQIAADVMGEDWINADHFRFGASGVLTNLLAVLDGTSETENNAAY